MSSDQYSPEWQRINPHANQSMVGDEVISVMTNGSVYINRFADRRHFDGYDYVYLHIDRQRGLLGFEPTSEEGKETVTVIREHEFGGSISAKSAIRRLGIDIDEVDETFRADPERFDPVIAIDVSPLIHRQHESKPEADTEETEPEQAADELSGEETTADPEQRRRELDAISQIEDETRQAIAGRIDTILASTDALEQTSSELCETLDLESISARVVGQHLRFLRDDDRSYPFTIGYKKTHRAENSYWELRRPDDLQSVGSSADESDSDADEPTDRDRIGQLIDSGVTDVHQLAVEADLQTTEVRAIARDLDRYSELHDAAEGGGYGRGGSE